MRNVLTVGGLNVGDIMKYITTATGVSLVPLGACAFALGVHTHDQGCRAFGICLILSGILLIIGGFET